MTSSNSLKTRHTLKFFGIYLRRFDLDPKENGAEAVLRKSPWVTLILGIMMAAFMSFPAIMAGLDAAGSNGDNRGAEEAARFLMLPGLAIMGCTILVCFWNWRRYAHITVTPDGFHVVRAGLFGSENYTLDHREFLGVLLREYVVKSKNSSTTYQVVELLHPDPDKSVPLYIHASRNPARDRMETLAKDMDLPGLRQSGNRIIGRDTDDLDKSIKERVAAGEIRESYDAKSTPPAGLSLEHQRIDGTPTLIVNILARRLPAFLPWLIGIFSAMPLVGIISDGEYDKLWIGVLVFCLFGGVMFLAARHDRNTPRRLLITPQEIRAEDAAAQNYGHRIGRSSLRLDDIEEVHTESSGMMHRVMISSDKGEMRVGNGISADAADWLSQFIISAIANADTAQPREPA